VVGPESAKNESIINDVPMPVPSPGPAGARFGSVKQPWWYIFINSVGVKDCLLSPASRGAAKSRAVVVFEVREEIMLARWFRQGCQSNAFHKDELNQLIIVGL
jgi:hypothetical protein